MAGVDRCLAAGAGGRGLPVRGRRRATARRAPGRADWWPVWPSTSRRCGGSGSSASPGLVAIVTLEALILALALALVPASGLVRIVAFPSALVAAEAVRGAFPFGGLPLAGIDLGQAGGPLAPAARLGGRLLIVGVVGLAGRRAGHACRGVRSGRRGARGWRRWSGAWRGSAWRWCWPRPGAVAPAGQESGRMRTAAVQGGGLRGLRAVDSDPGRVFERPGAGLRRAEDRPRPGAVAGGRGRRRGRPGRLGPGADPVVAGRARCRPRSSPAWSRTWAPTGS